MRVLLAVLALASAFNVEVDSMGEYVVVETVELVDVVVPRSNLAIATTLSARQLDTVSWPKEHLPPGALHDVSQAEGRVVRRPVANGEVLVEL